MLKNIEQEFSVQNWQALQLELEDAESRMRHGGWGIPNGWCQDELSPRDH